ncbi:MAG: hypothetical protein HPAVJP_4410 [Candidatus Hepatoplasma vulgare]|nr:MAG: hypothetical protein HPAVJP_4410 [Candidatus Hepatoplasma sp.]
MRKNEDFLYWLKTIEIKELNRKYEKKIKNFINEKSKYLSIDYEIYINEIKNYLNKSRDEIKKINNLKIEKIENLEINSIEKNILNLGNWLNELEKIYNFFLPENLLINKMWKYKILYFMFAGFIYINQKLRNNFYSMKDISKNEINKIVSDNFFLNEENIKWYAFENGPITSHYNYLTMDDPIQIDFDSIDKNTKSILEKCYLTLKKFSLEILIQESHKTLPWSKNWDSSKLWVPIDKKDIITYFQKNLPFYLE